MSRTGAALVAWRGACCGAATAGTWWKAASGGGRVRGGHGQVSDTGTRPSGRRPKGTRGEGCSLSDYAITADVLFDGSGGEPVDRPVVTISDGRIAAIGQRPPRGLPVLDLEGCSLLPG